MVYDAKNTITPPTEKISLSYINFLYIITLILLHWPVWCMCTESESNSISMSQETLTMQAKSMPIFNRWQKLHSRCTVRSLCWSLCMEINGEEEREVRGGVNNTQLLSQCSTQQYLSEFSYLSGVGKHWL